MPLAYVFAHAPAVSADRDDYVERLLHFHGALADDPPAGFLDSWVWEIGSGPVGTGFEDWYLVTDWAALGLLGSAAISGTRKAPHDASAMLSGSGAGALYAQLSPAPRPGARYRLRIDKAREVGYESFEADLHALDGAVWKRQLVLGADREFLVDLEDRPAEHSFGDVAEIVDLRRVSGPRR